MLIKNEDDDTRRIEGNIITLGADGAQQDETKFDTSCVIFLRILLVIWTGACFILYPLRFKIIYQLQTYISIVNNELTTFNKGYSSNRDCVEKPNFIFVLVDDMGYDSLSAEITPFLVSLRHQGVTLSSYYAQELCTPSRSSVGIKFTVYIYSIYTHKP